ncbi:MAG: hypothetical protein AAGA80_23750 [Cyanobacteria bacterium P01_F01_bin.143]
MKETVSPERVDYDIREDYEELVKESIRINSTRGSKICQLFEEEIYPNFS